MSPGEDNEEPWDHHPNMTLPLFIDRVYHLTISQTFPFHTILTGPHHLTHIHSFHQQTFREDHWEPGYTLGGRGTVENDPNTPALLGLALQCRTSLWGVMLPLPLPGTFANVRRPSFWLSQPGEEVLLAPSGWKPGVLLKTLQCTGQSPQQRMTWPKTSAAPGLEDTVLGGSSRE